MLIHEHPFPTAPRLEILADRGRYLWNDRETHAVIYDSAVLSGSFLVKCSNRGPFWMTLCPISFDEFMMLARDAHGLKFAPEAFAAWAGLSQPTKCPRPMGRGH